MSYKWLAVLALGLAACGPTDQEVGMAVLVAMPAIVIGGGLLQLLYHMAWKTLDPDLPRFDARPTGALLAASIAAALVLAGDITDETGIAIWLAGTSYVAVLALPMRMTIKDRVYSWIAVAPWLLATPVAAFLAVAGSDTGEAGWSLAYFVLPGYMGLPGGVLVTALFGEVLIRQIRQRQRARAAAPELPEARVRSD